MAKPAARILLLQGLLAIGGVVILARSTVVQIFEHAQWKARADQRRSWHQLPARRGTIFDRNGVVLAASEPRFRLSITVRELKDSAAIIKQLPDLLGISPERIRKEFTKPYPSFYGPFTAEQIAPIRNERGVHETVVYRRVYPQDSTGVALIGALNDSGSTGIGGLESSLDTLLRGAPGEERAWRDAKGQLLESPGDIVREPVAGNSVYLTIDRELQSIAEAELLKTIQKYNAHGGDFVIYEVATGELLAAASFTLDERNGKMMRSATAITDQKEPGSTSKLFTAAAILKSGSDTTPVSGEGGVWVQKVSSNYSRTFRDVHKVNGMLGLGDAIKFSSNIAMSKFSLRLNGETQFETLRDFGFGAPLALNFPKESGGVLYPPAEWDNPQLARPSMATGYFFEASVATIAAAYGAIGNHGILMAPSIIREIRTAGNLPLWRHAPTELRRAIPDSVAAHLLEYLHLVTDSGGTGVQAQLDDGSLVGKTGTAVVNSRHKDGDRKYRASFAGLYPMANPRVAFAAMIDRPEGKSYFGGTVAAPMIRSALQNAIALLSSPIDHKRATVISSPSALANAAPTVESDHPVPFPLQRTTPFDTAIKVLPDLSGRSIREAAYALHQLGFKVKLVGRGRVTATVPAAGDSLPRGGVVTVRADSTQ